ncbi:unnamed protein product [Aphanomyces euteiches]
MATATVASSLHELLTSQTRQERAEGQNSKSISPYIPTLTRLLHAYPTGTSRTAVVEIQDLLFDQPDATLGKEYAMAFRQVSLDDIMQKGDLYDPSVFPDTGNLVTRIEWVVGTLHAAISTQRETGKLPQVQWGANSSHVMELQCIICHALARDWLPVAALVPVLLETSMAATLLVTIVQNDPSASSTVVESVLAYAKKSDMDQFDKTHDVLFALGGISLSTAHLIRSYCIDQSSDSSFAAAAAIALTLEYINDLPLFFNRIMQGSKHAALWSVISESHQDPTNSFRVRCNALVERVRSHFQSLLEQPLPSQSSKVSLVVLLRAYCGLMGRGSVVLTDKETQLVFQAISNACRSSAQSSHGVERFVHVSVAAIVLICLGKLDAKAQPVVAQEARRLLQQLFEMDPTRSGVVLLMLSLLLYTKPTMVADLLRSLVDSMLVVAVDRLPLFGEHVVKLDFPEPVLVHRLLAMTPPQDINATSSSLTHEFTLRVAYSLLCERSYVRHKVNPTEWVLSLVFHATLPVHPILPNLMVELVENHVAAYDMSMQKSAMPALRPTLVHDTIAAVMTKKDANTWTRVVLLLVYVLHFNRRHVKDKSSRKYDVFDLPVATLFRTVTQSSHVGAAYEFVFPVLSRLVMDECPLVLEPSVESPLDKWAIPSTNHPLRHQTAVTPADMPTITTLLCDLEREVSMVHIVPWLEWMVTIALPIAMGPLDVSTPSIFSTPAASDKLARPTTRLAFPPVCGLIALLCHRALSSHATPDALRLRLVNVLCPDSQFAYQDILEEPFSILRCDPRIWRYGPLLGLVLDLLGRFREVSALHLRQLHGDDAIHATPTSTMGAMDMSQYILVQDSIAVHALLNVAERLNAEDAQVQRRRIFTWLDYVFRQTPTLLLAVHSQGYAKSLVHLAVRELPSLYELMPSMPDLLSTNDLAKLVFRCHLASALFKKYPDAVAPSVLKGVVAKVKLVYDTDRSQTSDKLLSPDVVDFLTAVLPALGAMAVSFCDIAEECVQLLMKLRVQVNHQRSDTLNASSAVDQLELAVHSVFAQIVRSSEDEG